MIRVKTRATALPGLVETPSASNCEYCHRCCRRCRYRATLPGVAGQQAYGGCGARHPGLAGCEVRFQRLHEQMSGLFLLNAATRIVREWPIRPPDQQIYPCDMYGRPSNASAVFGHTEQGKNAARSFPDEESQWLIFQYVKSLQGPRIGDRSDLSPECAGTVYFTRSGKAESNQNLANCHFRNSDFAKSDGTC